jgi:predicted secreted protein
MMIMSGYFGNGGVMKIGSTTVSEVTNISPPGFSADAIDTTTHNNSTRFREFVKGLIDPGEVSIEGNFNYTDYATVYAAMATTSLQSITITVPTSPSTTTFVCNGILTALEVADPHDDKVSFNATAKISGKPTITVA